MTWSRHAVSGLQQASHLSRRYAKIPGFTVKHSPVPELSFLPALHRGWTRAGEKRVQDNLHAYAQNAAIFPPNRAKIHIWKYFPDSACGAIFWIIIYKQQFLHSDWLKTCQSIPNHWNFTRVTINQIRFVFTTISKIAITKEISVKICWQLKTPTRTWKCTR